MAAGVLDNLKSESLLLPTLALNSAPALREFLRHTAEVNAVKTALERGSTTELSVRRFVCGLMVDLRKQVLFPHDITVAALAVAVERLSMPWIDTFLEELSSLNMAEMPFSSRAPIEEGIGVMIVFPAGSDRENGIHERPHQLRREGTTPQGRCQRPGAISWAKPRECSRIIVKKAACQAPCVP